MSSNSQAALNTRRVGKWLRGKRMASHEKRGHKAKYFWWQMAGRALPKRRPRSRGRASERASQHKRGSDGREHRNGARGGVVRACFGGRRAWRRGAEKMVRPCRVVTGKARTIIESRLVTSLTWRRTILGRGRWRPPRDEVVSQHHRRKRKRARERLPTRQAIPARQGGAGAGCRAPPSDG